MDPNQTIDPSTLNQYSGINMGSSPMLMPLPYNYPGYNTQGMTPGAMQQGAFADQMAFYNQSTSSAIMNQTSNMMMRDLQSVLQGSMMAAGQLQATAHSMTQRAVGMFAQPNDMVGQGRQFAIETSFVRDVSNWGLNKLGASKDGFLNRLLVGRKPDFLSQAEYEKAFELSMADRFSSMNKMGMGVAAVGSSLAMLPGVGWAGMAGLAIAEPIVSGAWGVLDKDMYHEKKYRELAKEIGFARVGHTGIMTSKQIKATSEMFEEHDTADFGQRVLRKMSWLGGDYFADLRMKDKFRYEDIGKTAIREGLIEQKGAGQEFADELRKLIPTLKEFAEKLRQAPEEVAKLMGAIKRQTGYDVNSSQMGVILSQSARLAKLTGMDQNQTIEATVASAMQLKAMGLDYMKSYESISKTAGQLNAYAHGGMVDEALKNGQQAFAVATEIGQRYAASKHDTVMMMAQMPGSTIQEKMGSLLQAGSSPTKFLEMQADMRNKKPTEAYAEYAKTLLMQYKPHLGSDKALWEKVRQELGIENEATFSAVRALVENGGKTTMAEIKQNILNADPEEAIQAIIKAEGGDRESAKKRLDEIRGNLQSTHKLFGDAPVGAEAYRGRISPEDFYKDVLTERLGGKNMLGAATKLQILGSGIQQLKKLGLSESDIKSMMVQGEGEGEISFRLMKKFGSDTKEFKNAMTMIQETKKRLNEFEKEGQFSYNDLLKNVSTISEDKQKEIQKLWDEIGEKDPEAFSKKATEIAQSAGATNTSAAILSSLRKDQAAKAVDVVKSKDNGYELLGGDAGKETREYAGKGWMGRSSHAIYKSGEEMSQLAGSKTNYVSGTLKGKLEGSNQIKFGNFVRSIADNEQLSFTEKAKSVRENYFKQIGITEQEFNSKSKRDQDYILGSMWRDIKLGDEGAFEKLDSQMKENSSKSETHEKLKAKDLQDFNKVINAYRGVFKEKYGKDLDDKEGVERFQKAQIGIWSVVGEEFRGKKVEDIKDEKEKKAFTAARQAFIESQDVIKASLSPEARKKYEAAFNDRELEKIAKEGMSKAQSGLFNSLLQEAGVASAKSKEELQRISENIASEDKTMEKASLDAVTELTKIMESINARMQGHTVEEQRNIDRKAADEARNKKKVPGNAQPQ